MTPQLLKRIAVTCTCCVLVSLSSVPNSRGDISLPKIFSDHMVLQRNSRVRIWGTADPGQQLTVTFAGNEANATATDKGSWSVNILTPGAGGPFELVVMADGGEPKVVFSDVMVGEVWLCSGQDNMELPVSASLNPETEIEQSKNFPLIRLFSVEGYASAQPLSDFHKVDPWRVCSPETVKDFSATAYFFGRELRRQFKGEKLQNVAIGLIDVSWSGTVCEAWTAREAMDGVPKLAPLLKYWDEQTDEPISPLRPGQLYNGMIAPMTRFPIRGVVWYQGEANVERGEQYATLFPTLIKNWRNDFGLGDFPFYFVQLAPYSYEQKSTELLPEIWDAQFKTLRSVPNTRMVVTTDIGNPQELVPKNKQEVGRRLALMALADVYADQLLENSKPVCCGPGYDTMLVDQDRIRITFKNVYEGLKIRNGDPELNCFLICGEDRKFVPASAKIDGQRVEVYSPDVKNPVAVRFAWDGTAQPNLINSHDLPASPFRTDDFPLMSSGTDF